MCHRGVGLLCGPPDRHFGQPGVYCHDSHCLDGAHLIFPFFSLQWLSRPLSLWPSYPSLISFYDLFYPLPSAHPTPSFPSPFRLSPSPSLQFHYPSFIRSSLPFSPSPPHDLLFVFSLPWHLYKKASCPFFRYPHLPYLPSPITLPSPILLSPHQSGLNTKRPTIVFFLGPARKPLPSYD